MRTRLGLRLLLGGLLVLCGGCDVFSPTPVSAVLIIAPTQTDPGSMTPWQGSGTIERFLFQVYGEKSNPCVGASRIEIVVEALEPGQDRLTSERRVSSVLNADLFWNPSSGECQLQQGGILLKHVPYGGSRKLTLLLYDSSDTLLAQGSTPSFKLESQGSGLSERIPLRLLRGCKGQAPSGECSQVQSVGLGTLVLRLPASAPIPAGTDKLIFQSKDSQGQELIRRIELNTNDPLPNFLILSALPAASRRAYALYALDAARRVTKTWKGSFSIPATPTASTATQRLEPAPAP